MTRAAGILGSLVVVAGCSVGPDYKEPAAPNVGGYTPHGLKPTVSSDVGGGARQTFDAKRDIPGDWWTLFHSPGLDQLMVEAYKNNPTLEAAQYSLKAAGENVYAAEGSFFPQVNGNFSAQRSKSSAASTGLPNNPAFDLYNASLNITYNLDVFGGTRRQVESLIAQRDYEAFQLEASYLSLTTNIVTAAVTEASAREQIKATQEIVSDEEKQLGIVRKRFDLGGASRADVLLQESNLRQEEATLPPLELQLAQTRNQLAAYAGRFPSEEILEKFNLDELHLPQSLPVSLPSQLVAQRPDIQASAALLHQASANIGVAVANRLPQISLTGSLGSTALEASQLFGPDMGLWSMAAGVAQPLFQGGTLLHRQKSSEQAFNQAAAQYQATVIAAFQDVSDVLNALEYDAQTLKAALAAEQSASESLKISSGQYKLGAVTYVDVLLAQQTHQTAVIALVRARATRYADTAALFQALGGGWWHRADIDQQPSFIENPL